MSRRRQGHRHFNRFFSCTSVSAPRLGGTLLLIRAPSDVLDDEHQAVKVAARTTLTHGRADMETLRCQVDRSDRAVYPGSLLRRLRHALDFAAHPIGGLALFFYHQSD